MGAPHALVALVNDWEVKAGKDAVALLRGEGDGGLADDLQRKVAILFVQINNGAILHLFGEAVKGCDRNVRYIIKDIDAEGGGEQNAALAPVLALGGDEAVAEEAHKVLVAHRNVLAVVALVGEHHALQQLRLVGEDDALAEEVKLHNLRFGAPRTHLIPRGCPNELQGVPQEGEVAAAGGKRNAAHLRVFHVAADN